jgi:hypothetical protein
MGRPKGYVVSEATKRLIAATRAANKGNNSLRRIKKSSEEDTIILKEYDENYKESQKRYGAFFKESFNEVFSKQSYYGIVLNKGKSYKAINKWLPNLSAEEKIEAALDFIPGLKGKVIGTVLENIGIMICNKIGVEYQIDFPYFIGKDSDTIKTADILITKKDGSKIVIYCQKDLKGGGSQTDRIGPQTLIYPKLIKERDTFFNLQWNPISFSRKGAVRRSLCNKKVQPYIKYPNQLEDMLIELKINGEV